MFGLRFEPAALTELVRQALYLLLLFGLVHWTDAQTTAVLMFVSLALTYFTRQAVTPNATILGAGQTPQGLKDLAAINRGTGNGSVTP